MSRREVEEREKEKKKKKTKMLVKTRKQTALRVSLVRIPLYQ